MNNFTQYKQMVVDIETLSPDKIKNGGVVITEIAARLFNIEDSVVTLGPLFSVIIDVPSQMAKGLNVNSETLQWHVKQGKDMNSLLQQKGTDLAEAVDSFLAWSRKNLHKDARVYAWGSDFDLPLIHKSYVSYTGESNTGDSFYPWRYGNYRCARTMFNELTEETGIPSSKPHIAEKDVDIEIYDMVQAWNFRRQNKLVIKNGTEESSEKEAQNTPSYSC